MREVEAREMVDETLGRVLLCRAIAAQLDVQGAQGASCLPREIFRAQGHADAGASFPRWYSAEALRTNRRP